MFEQVILRDTTKEDWPLLREKIVSRIMKTFGTSPVPLEGIKNEFHEVERYENYGLTHIKIRYHVLDDEWADAIIVLPENLTNPAPAVLTIHGTNNVIGKYGMLDVEGTPRRAYAIELAKRGFVTIAQIVYIIAIFPDLLSSCGSNNRWTCGCSGCFGTDRCRSISADCRA